MEVILCQQHCTTGDEKLEIKLKCSIVKLGLGHGGYLAKKYSGIFNEYKKFRASERIKGSSVKEPG